MGGVAYLKVGGSHGEGHLTAMEYIAPPGFASPLHIHHDADEAWYVVEGVLTFESDGWSTDAPPGSFVLVRRGSPHRYTVGGDGSARFVELFTAGGKEEFFKEMAARREALGGQRPPYEVAKAIYEKHHMTLLAEPW